MKWVKLPFKIEKQYRLKNWDYSNSGWYFVTICTKDRNVFFVGTDPCVRSWNRKYQKLCEFPLNKIGEMVQKWWQKIPDKFNNVLLDEFIIMPDHIHGILVIKNKIAQTHGSVPTKNQNNDGSVPTNNNKLGQVGLLGEIIQWFKTMSTNEYIKNVNENNWPKFNKRIWQSRFYDRIIRNEKEYWAIKQYIKNNPKNWQHENNELL